MIPKIIHRIWIGNPDHCPADLMKGWLDKHPVEAGWEHRLWSNEHAPTWTSEGRSYCAGGAWENAASIAQLSELCGKADVMRYEILRTYGGIYVDADTQCLRSLDEAPGLFLEPSAWVPYENEVARPGFVTNCYLGSEPGHRLWDVILSMLPHRRLTMQPAWQSIGPQLLTEAVALVPDVVRLPSSLLLPKHFTGVDAGKLGRFAGQVDEIAPFASHFWGSVQGYGPGGLTNRPARLGTPSIRDRRASPPPAPAPARPMHSRFRPPSPLQRTPPR
jgi:inositol phosphorylceramide mannosyltransferase catalytic subunit